MTALLVILSQSGAMTELATRAVWLCPVFPLDRSALLPIDFWREPGGRRSDEGVYV
jgi:hypothetical protein